MTFTLWRVTHAPTNAQLHVGYHTGDILEINEATGRDHHGRDPSKWGVTIEPYEPGTRPET